MLNALCWLWDEKNWVAEATEEELAARQLRAEADQRRSNPDKKRVREEAEKREEVPR